jgi:hypothetical protein
MRIILYDRLMTNLRLPNLTMIIQDGRQVPPGKKITPRGHGILYIMRWGGTDTNPSHPADFLEIQRSLFCATASQSSSSYSRTLGEAATFGTGLGNPGGIKRRRRFEGNESGKRTAVIGFTSSSLKRECRGPCFGAFGVLGVATLTSLPSILLKFQWFSTD